MHQIENDKGGWKKMCVSLDLSQFISIFLFSLFFFIEEAKAGNDAGTERSLN